MSKREIVWICIPCGNKHTIKKIDDDMVCTCKKGICDICGKKEFTTNSLKFGIENKNQLKKKVNHE